MATKPRACPRLGTAAFRKLGRVCVFLDADDRLLPQHFDISLDAFRVTYRCGRGLRRIQYFGNEPPWRYNHRCDPRPDQFGLFLRSVFRRDSCGNVSSRSSMKSGGFDERLQSSENREFYWSFIRQASLYCHHQVITKYWSVGPTKDEPLVHHAGIRLLHAEEAMAIGTRESSL